MTKATLIGILFFSFLAKAQVYYDKTICVSSTDRTTALDVALEKKIEEFRMEKLTKVMGKEFKGTTAGSEAQSLTSNSSLSTITVNGKIEERIHRELCAVAKVDVSRAH